MLTKKETYDSEYNSQKDAAKEKKKVKVNIVAAIAFILAVVVCYYFLKFIPIDIICGYAIFSGVKMNLYEKITSHIKPNVELEKVSKEISEIENRYRNENYVIQDKLATSTLRVSEAPPGET